jgi:hypothetical protein
MRNNREYQICKDIAQYMRLQHPAVIFHWDYAGLNLSKAQAGRMKAIQSNHKWPDLYIAEPRDKFHGMFLEIKSEGTRLYKKNTEPATPHLNEQEDCLFALEDKDYFARFAVGFDEAKKLIDDYLR